MLLHITLYLPSRIGLLRSFHSSPVLRLEPKFWINGAEVTRDSVLALHPAERSVAQWSILVDWDLQRSRPWVIVDPLDETGLLYLNRAEYLKQQTVCGSNALEFKVIARPGTRPPVLVDSTSSSSQNSPWGGLDWDEGWNSEFQTPWKRFLKLRANVARLVSRVSGTAMVSGENVDTISRSVLLWVRSLAHYTEAKNPETIGAHFQPLIDHLKILHKHNGSSAVVSHLKLSLFALYSYISGNPVSSTQHLGWGMRLRSCGLPVSFGPVLINQIKQGKVNTYRLVASVLNLYRALDAPHKKFSVSSIVAPHPILDDSKEFEEFKIFLKEHFGRILLEEANSDPSQEKISLDYHYRSGVGHLIQSAGANVTGPAMGSLVLDARAWAKAPVNHVLNWFELHGDLTLKNLMSISAQESHFPSDARETPHNFPGYQSEGFGDVTAFAVPTWATRMPKGHDPSACVLGRLHAIDEPAGKVRVVAICDYWTQVALKSVHDHLFKILKRISTDATFDQSGVVKAYFQQGLHPHWSFDLKAATDTIPLALYKEVLAILLAKPGEDANLTKDRVNLWAKIMTDRDFVLPEAEKSVRYGTGQPMGALSSWASMAFVHHALVQFAHFRAKGTATWYKFYLVLGDDVDIARHESVATQYQQLCSAYQIVIGLAKSLRSNVNCFEFANRRFYPDGDISPLSFKEELQAQTWMGRLEFARRMLDRFGTSLKDNSMAVVRRAATVAQWRVLVPEASGLRPSSILHLVRWVLLTPFQETGQVARIDSIIDWLSPILPKKSRDNLVSLKESTELKKDLEYAITEALLKDLKSLLLKKLSAIPLPFSHSERVWTTTNSQIDPVDVTMKWNKFIKKELGITLPTAKKVVIASIDWWSSVDTNPPGSSSVAWLYVLYCVSQHNNRTEESIRLLLSHINRQLKALTYFYSEYDRVPAFKGSRFEGLTPFDRACLLWDETLSLPEILVPDPNKPLGAWLTMDVPQTGLGALFDKRSGAYRNRVLNDVVRAPLTSITLALAKVTGFSLPPIPYHVRKPGGSWSGLMSRAIKYYNVTANFIFEEGFLDSLAKGRDEYSLPFVEVSTELVSSHKIMRKPLWPNVSLFIL